MANRRLYRYIKTPKPLAGHHPEIVRSEPCAGCFHTRSVLEPAELRDEKPFCAATAGENGAALRQPCPALYEWRAGRPAPARLRPDDIAAFRSDRRRSVPVQVVTERAAPASPAVRRCAKEAISH